MKQFISKLRMSISLLLLAGFWCISVSGNSSDSDRVAGGLPCVYRTPMDPTKNFRASIGLRWTYQKDSTPLSDSDRPDKKFPCLYRTPIAPIVKKRSASK